MKPKVVMHTQVSLDGRIRGFDNPEIYYQVAGGILSDAVVFGSNTVLTAFENCPEETKADFFKPEVSPEDPRPIGVIVDSKGILRNLHAVRNLVYLKAVVVLVSNATPREYIQYLEEREYPYIMTGEDYVDYEKAFQLLSSQYGCTCIRTDSGAGLTNILLKKGLVDEISLILSPCLVGSKEKFLFDHLELEENINLEFLSMEIMNVHYLALRYNMRYNTRMVY